MSDLQTHFVVTFERRGDLWEGARADPPIVIRARKLGIDLEVTLLCHDQPIGSGVLRRVGDTYRGEVSEYAGKWHVTGRVGVPALDFHDKAPA